MTQKTYPEVQFENNVSEVIIDDTDFTIDKNSINTILGYTDNNSQAYFDNYIDDLLFNLSDYVKIKSGYRITDVQKSSSNKGGVCVNGTVFTMGKIVTGQLRKADKAAVFLCTIGPQFENLSRELLKNGDPAHSYIVNTIASVAVENATNLLHDHVGQKMLEQGLPITNRYSPGYCNWSVSEQHLLFSLLPDQFCGIQLTDSALMLPIKSVSGIIGIGKNVKRADYLCDRCNEKDCTYRAIKSREISAQH